MEYRTDMSLKALNTFGVEARADRYIRFDSAAEILEFTRQSDLRAQRHLVLGAGSNLLFVGDFPGVVLHPMLRGTEVVGQDRDHVRLRAMAGEAWDDLVALAVANGWGGLENLSRIPGSVGASVVQNIGAYGVEVKGLVDCVEAISLRNPGPVAFKAADCGFGYRHSRFKGPWRGRYIITAVVFRLPRRPRLVLDYPGVREAMARLGPPCAATLREAVIAVRTQKLPDPAAIGNAGSFFKNPVIDEGRMKSLLERFPGMPCYPLAGRRYKAAAGWMIERCGWKGRAVGNAAVHDRQALVLVNLGGGTGCEILALSECVRRSVLETFGVNLEREVEVIGLPPPGRRPGSRGHL